MDRWEWVLRGFAASTLQRLLFQRVLCSDYFFSEYFAATTLQRLLCSDYFAATTTAVLNGSCGVPPPGAHHTKGFSHEIFTTGLGLL